jgi:hypothetical protein
VAALPDSYLDAHRYDGAALVHDRRERIVPCAIQPRDFHVVQDVWRYKFLTAPQLHELFWPGESAWPPQRRLRKLFLAGLLERFRPLAKRGSYPWTYHVGEQGHRILRDAGVLPPGSRYKPRRLYDFGRVLHELQLNAWVLALRRHAGPAFLTWDGECSLAPERPPRSELDDPIRRVHGDWSAEGLRDERERPVWPDAVIELARSDDERYRKFLVEFDRTQRLDKNFDKFRRYDNLVGSWWRHTQLADHDDPPYILFVCQNQAQRDDFLTRADQELTGHRWHPSHPTEQHQYVGRRRILFCDERDIHHRHLEARRLPPYPPGHPARNGSDAEIREVRLPGRPELAARDDPHEANREVTVG